VRGSRWEAAPLGLHLRTSPALGRATAPHQHKRVLVLMPVANIIRMEHVQPQYDDGVAKGNKRVHLWRLPFDALHGVPADVPLPDDANDSEYDEGAGDVAGGEGEEEDDERSVASAHDEECGGCGEGGELLVCEHPREGGCSRAYHFLCAGFETAEEVSEGPWYCPDCAAQPGEEGREGW